MKKYFCRQNGYDFIEIHDVHSKNNIEIVLGTSNEQFESVVLNIDDAKCLIEDINKKIKLMEDLHK